MLIALLAILLETMEDVLLTKPVASEAGGKGKDEIGNCDWCGHWFFVRMNVTPRIAITGAIAVNASRQCWSVTSSGVEVNVSMMLMLEKSKCVLCLLIRQDQVWSTIEVSVSTRGLLPAIQECLSRTRFEWNLGSTASGDPVSLCGFFCKLVDEVCDVHKSCRIIKAGWDMQELFLVAASATRGILATWEFANIRFGLLFS